MKKQRCPYCDCGRPHNSRYECGSHVGSTWQSELCRERCKVAEQVEAKYWQDLQTYSEETCNMLIKQISEMKK